MNEKELVIKIAEITRTAKLRERQHEREVDRLNERIRDLENDNALLLDLLAQVMKDSSPSIVIREENFGRKHEFKSGENMAGEPVLTLVR